MITLKDNNTAVSSEGLGQIKFALLVVHKFFFNVFVFFVQANKNVSWLLILTEKYGLDISNKQLPLSRLTKYNSQHLLVQLL
jgi:hypothetical protein